MEPQRRHKRQQHRRPNRPSPLSQPLRTTQSITLFFFFHIQIHIAHTNNTNARATTIIPSSLIGTYTIDTFGTGVGSYTITIDSIAANGTTVSAPSLTGTTSLGVTETHRLYLPFSGVALLDDTPPVTQLAVGEPKYIWATQTYVTKDSSFTLTADDGTGSGVASTAYRISSSTYGLGWTHYATPFNLTSLSDGCYALAYNSTDNAGNVEQSNTVTIAIDNAPPTTSLAIGDPKYPTVSSPLVTSTTSYALSATDGSGSILFMGKILNPTD